MVDDFGANYINDRFQNNLFIASGTRAVVDGRWKGGGVVLQNNVYYNADSPLRIVWANIEYTSLNDFSAATGQETINGQFSGLQFNPLVDGTFRLQPGSPAIGRGLDLRTFDGGTTIGNQDYFGQSLSAVTRFDVGAYQSAP